ncbi:MAG TPA: acyl-CoA dehydrogenase family protein [Deltaproteobacteria bacterium]|jgi:isovaleryl-CoA dehydrogenase|nr:acyl-CoA dehydrogenase family protein [Deltaproteobacteria bacterium]OQC28225.1 MAG: Acyl-CoA dehydrogenase [Deltaproteobacteria bacterium ADurb.Bin072]HRW79629.1 acyl-CoA dehydrogenase family protein [Desulfomonilia bacterium]NMD40537.1 isovaleryl-CoA dehydrogenase [Deltaproteobacteria bacterium]HNQ84697.1 acyl-CoA dehydrogenase family protein [Deltaproteobacteria bacterium]
MDFDLTEEHLILRETVRRFAQQEIEPRVSSMDRDETFDEYLWKKGAELGFVGMGISTEYGGSFSDHVSLGVMAEEVSRIDPGVAVVFGAHTVLCGNNIERNGTDDQKRRYLPLLASGSRRGCMGITEPEAGSDALSIRTRARRDGSVYVLNGSKMFISNAPIADTALIYAATDPSRGHGGLSAFIVEKEFPGYHRGKSLSKLGLRSSPTGEIILEDCIVPEENLLGGAQGNGLSIMFSGLDVERILWSCQAVGIAGAAFDAALKYARERRQFSQPLITFQMIQDKLANMLVEIEAARLMAYKGLACLDQKRKRQTRMIAAQVKLYACEMVNRVTSEALQIHGGYGYMKEFPLERYLRDGRAYAIGAGTSEIQKLIIGGYLMA